MPLPAFKYCRPESIPELEKLLCKNQGKAKILAGGTDLLVQMKGATQNPAVLQNPALLIDIGNIKSLKGILGKKIETIEGLSENGKLHPIQDSFVENGAIQCGYCTPGMILSAKALLAKNDNPTNEEIKYGMAGNFCRCTGYKKIIDAVHEAAGRLQQDGN